MATETAGPEEARLVAKPISYEEAQQIVTFELLMPDPLPDSLQFNIAFVPDHESLGSAVLRFSLSEGINPYGGIDVWERAVADAPDPGDLRRSVMLDETEITKVTNVSPSWCWLYRAYEWEQDGVYFAVSTRLSGDVTDEILLDLVAATMSIDPAELHESALATLTPEEERFGQPTDKGRYCGVSLDQAREIVDFEIVMPDPLPSQLVFDHLYIESPIPMEDADLSTTTATASEHPLREPNLVVMLFRDTAAADYWTFAVLQQGTSNRIFGPFLREQLKEKPVVVIDDVEVIKWVEPIYSSSPDWPQTDSLTYFWQTGGLSFRLGARTASANRPAFDNMLEELIATLISE